jgi:hypothetical protein
MGGGLLCLQGGRWTEPGAQPDRDSVTDDGTTVVPWTRDVSEVRIAADDTVEGFLLNAATSAATDVANTSRRSRDRGQHPHDRAAGVGHSGTTGLRVAGCDTRTSVKAAVNAELV